MKKIIIEVILVVIITIVSNVGFLLVHNNLKVDYQLDTVYNTVWIDSIINRITIRDSIILKIKEDEKEEINEALNDDDSIAVKRFYQLVNE